MAAAAVATVAAAAPLATVPAPLRAFSMIESTVLPIEPTVSVTDSTVSLTPLFFAARLVALAALLRLEAERVRGDADVFFAELPFLLDVERALALFFGFAVLGKGVSWVPD
jgi:hypothetical protein